MDSCDTIVKNDNEADKQIQQKEIADRQPNVGYVFSTFWLRRTFRIDNEVDRFLLDYGFNFLLYFGIFLWCLFLLVS